MFSEKEEKKSTEGAEAQSKSTEEKKNINPEDKDKIWPVSSI